MRVLIQRSLNSSVKFEEKTNKINKGFVLFVGFTDNDNLETIDYMIKKILNLRIFEDENGKMNKNIKEVNGEILSISQFTLYASLKGNRPSFTKALDKDKADLLYNEFNNRLSKFINVKTGKFGSNMLVNINNDGPVTILLEK